MPFLPKRSYGLGCDALNPTAVARIFEAKQRPSFDPLIAHVPDLVAAGLPTVAVQMPSHPVAQSLMREAGVPIAAPSANLFAYVSPTCAQHVAEKLGDRVDLILDGGPCPLGLESTVVAMVGP